MSYPRYTVFFRGHPACPCLAVWLPAYEKELLRRGVIKHNIDIYQLIGGAVASGGTHARGGAFDLHQTQAEAIHVARQMGADATWHRPFNWDRKGGIEHTHGVLRGCPHNWPARYQIAAVDAGFNGLGWLGRGGMDRGPRPLSKRTWKEGITWAKRQENPDYADHMDPNSYHVGAHNDAVLWLAKRLVAHGYKEYYINGVDKDFTAGEDQQAVKAFQQDQGWRRSDGLPGKEALRRLARP